AQSLDDVGGADAVGHGPGHVGVAQAVVGAEGRVAQVLQAAGRRVARARGTVGPDSILAVRTEAAVPVSRAEGDGPVDSADRLQDGLFACHGSLSPASRQPVSEYGRS